MSVQDTTFIDNNPPKANAEFLNSIVNESNNNVLASGQTLNISDPLQTSKASAISGSRGDYYKEAGGSAADVYVLETVGAQESIVTLEDGMRFRFKVVNPNTGASTLDVSGTGAKDIKKLDNDLILGDLLLGGISIVTYNGTSDEYELFFTDVPLPKGYISGLDPSNNTIDPNHDIDISPGSCRDSTDEINIKNKSTIIKKLDATWTEGDSLGGLANGVSLTINTWYHIHALGKTNGTFDFIYDTSVIASNALSDPAVISAGYTSFKWLGAILTDGSSNIIPGNWRANYFSYLDRQVDESTTSTGTFSLTLSTPLGIESRADILGRIFSQVIVSWGGIEVKEIAQNIGGFFDLVLHVDSTAASAAVGNTEIWTDTSSQINWRDSNNNGTNNREIVVKGYYVERGTI